MPGAVGFAPRSLADRAHRCGAPAAARAADPVRMAEAFKAAVEAGRAAYEIGLAPKRKEADATSPLTGFLNER